MFDPEYPILSYIPFVRRAGERVEGRMPVCKSCGDEVDELHKVKVQGRMARLCEDCADAAREEGEIAEESEAVVQQMMGFKGRR